MQIPEFYCMSFPHSVPLIFDVCICLAISMNQLPINRRNCKHGTDFPHIYKPKCSLRYKRISKVYSDVSNEWHAAISIHLNLMITFLNISATHFEMSLPFPFKVHTRKHYAGVAYTQQGILLRLLHTVNKQRYFTHNRCHLYCIIRSRNVYISIYK